VDYVKRAGAIATVSWLKAGVSGITPNACQMPCNLATHRGVEYDGLI